MYVAEQAEPVRRRVALKVIKRHGHQAGYPRHAPASAPNSPVNCPTILRLSSIMRDSDSDQAKG